MLENLEKIYYTERDLYLCYFLCFFFLQVSWIRKRDLHILTSSIYTFTGDARFSVKHPETSDEWRLNVQYVQPRDAGIYECQVNTEPKMNLAFSLRVEGNLCFTLFALKCHTHQRVKVFLIHRIYAFAIYIIETLKISIYYRTSSFVMRDVVVWLFFTTFARLNYFSLKDTISLYNTSLLAFQTHF